MRNPEGIAAALKKAQKIAICCHINPDGDTIGSGLAMRLILQGMGKQATVFCQDKAPDNLFFLPGVGEIRTPEQAEPAYDLMLSVDVSTPERMGSCWEVIRPRCAATAQLDHHGTNPLFMEVNSVDGNACATCVMIWRQMQAMDLEMTRDIAMCLYTGISTDTGNFSFSCTDTEAFEAMADLMRSGIPLTDMNFFLFREKSRPQLALLGRAIASLRFLGPKQDLAVMTLTLADFDACHAKNEHADTIVNYALETVGTRMAMLGREDLYAPGMIKFSLRAVAPLQVDGIAERLGGGGHAQAAGISMAGTLDDCVARVAAEMEKVLAENPG